MRGAWRREIVLSSRDYERWRGKTLTQSMKDTKKLTYFVMSCKGEVEIGYAGE